MRSILKSHKRTDSSVSDSSTLLEPPSFHKTNTFRAKGSPGGSHSEKFTSPKHGSGFHQSSRSSPKKLLTPIKKIFGHHSKPTAVPSANESLQSMLSGDFEPPQGRQLFLKGRSSVPDLTELRRSSYSSQGNTIFESLSSRSLYGISGSSEGGKSVNGNSMNGKSVNGNSINANSINANPVSENPVNANPIEAYVANDSKFIFTNPGLQPLPDNEIHSPTPNTVDSQSKYRSTREIPMIQRGASDLSISKSKNTSLLLPIQSHTVNSQNGPNDEDDEYDDDDDSRNSDSSSQFSFVRDIRGGRNTSVKYYKTKTITASNDAEKAHNYFNIDEFDAEAFSEYDFENNGLDDDDNVDFGDEVTPNNSRYEKFLLDKDNTLELVALEASLHSSSGYVNAGRSANLDESYLSLDRFSLLRTSSPKSSDYAGEFLDTYLDSRSSHLLSSPPNPPSAPQADLDHLSKPGSNNHSQTGLGILFSDDSLQSATSSQHVDDQMKMLTNWDNSPFHEKDDPLMCDTTDQTVLADSTQTSRNVCEKSEVSDSPNLYRRKSVEEMMATLTFLGKMDTVLPETRSAELTNEPRGDGSHNSKRYSWLSDDCSPSEAESKSPHFEGSSSSLTFEEDLLDEVNSIPENYDFSHHEDDTETPLHHGFLRSHSYSKKPQKMVVERSFSERKLQLPNKTVTFYRSKSLDQANARKTRYSSFTSPLKCVTSFDENHIRKSSSNKKLEEHANQQPSCYRSNKSTTRKLASLEPITESAAARIN